MKFLKKENLLNGDIIGVHAKGLVGMTTLPMEGLVLVGGSERELDLCLLRCYK